MYSSNYATRSAILQCIKLVMNVLWLVVLLANFSRFSSEKAAYPFENGVLSAKNENLEGSIDGVPPPVPTPLPSDIHHQPLTRDLPNGLQSVEPSGIQPKRLDTEELRTGFQWRSQNDAGKRESLTWWWMKWKQQQLVEQQQQYKLKWVHHRWRRQPPFLSQQQYYRWRRQQPMKNSVQNFPNVRRLNPINRDERILNKSQLKQEGDLQNAIPRDKFILWDRITTRTPNGPVYRDGQLEENKLNSALVEGQNIQKLENSFAKKSQNRTSNQLDIQKANFEKQNKVLHLSSIKHSVSTPRVLDSRPRILEKGKQKFGLSSSQLPSTKPQLSGSVSPISPRNQTEQQQFNTFTFSSSEADEESASSSENSWTNKESYPIWKPPLPGLDIPPVVDTHTDRGENLLPKRHDSAKSLIQAGSHSKSDEQFRTLRDSDVQHETWVFGVNLSYKKIKNNIGFLEQPKSVSQPTSPYQQSNSITQEEKQPVELSARHNEHSDQMKPNWGSDVTVTKLSGLPRSLDIPMTEEANMNEKLERDNGQKHENKVDREYIRRNQITGDDVPSKDAAMVGCDTKSHLQVLSSHQKNIQANNSFSEESGSLSLPQGLSSSVPNIGEAENMQELVQFQKIQITPANLVMPQREDVDSTSKSSMTVEPELYPSEISVQTDAKLLYNTENNTNLRSEELTEFGSNVDEIVPRFSNATNTNFGGHSVDVKSDTSESSTPNKLFEVDKSYSGIFIKSTFGLENYNLNASTPFAVLKTPQIEEKKNNDLENYSDPKLVRKELSSSYADSDHITSNQLIFSNGSLLRRQHQLLGSNRPNVHLFEKRTLDSRGSSPKETDNQRLSNMESLGGPMNIDPYDKSLQNTDPSKSSVDMELSSNELEYLFQAISSGMKLLMNKIMGNSR